MLVRLLGLRRRDEGEPTAHPEVDHEGRPTLGPGEVDQEVFAPPSQGEDRPPGHPLRQFTRLYRDSQARIPDERALDRIPYQMGLQAATEDFDLGKLGHGKDSTLSLDLRRNLA